MVADDRQDLEPYAKLYLVGVIISGIIWGTTPYLTYPAFPMPEMLIVFLVLMGIATGAALSLPASRWYFLAFAIPEMLPLTIRFIEQGELGYMIAAIGIIVLVPAFYLASLEHYVFMKNMSDLANKNAELASRLQDANIELTVEVAHQQEYEKSVRERDNALQHLNDPGFGRRLRISAKTGKCPAVRVSFISHGIGCGGKNRWQPLRNLGGGQ